MLLLAVEPLQQGKTPGRLGTTDRSTPFHRKTGLRNLRSYESSRQSSTKIVSASSCSSKSLSKTCLTRRAEVSVEGLEKCIDRSSGTGSQNNLSATSLERVRMLWRQRCCCATCPSHRTPKHDASETRCRLCSRWRQFSKQRARPPDVEGQLLKNAMSQPKTKRRCRSISSHPLEGKRPRSSSPSTTNVYTTRDATSTRIVAVGMGTRKNAVTVPTAAGDTTATRTGWPQNHQAHGCSAGQSAARRCPARSDRRPALQSTTARPNQSCGWRISGWPVS